MRSFITCTLNQILLRYQIKDHEWAGHVAFMGMMIYAYRILIGKPKRKRPLAGPRCKWENIRANLKGSGKLRTGFVWHRIGTGGGLL
jgi:hypothetical protein